MTDKISDGVVHQVPSDMAHVLQQNSQTLEKWKSLTPLARNEWICWVESVKKQETREHHLKRLVTDLKAGKRRPCCWIGCIHRTDKKISPSVQGILNKRTSKKNKVS